MGKQSNEAESSLVHSVCVVAKHVLFIYKSNKIKKYMANNLKNLFPNPFPFLHIHKKKRILFSILAQATTPINVF